MSVFKKLGKKLSETSLGRQLSLLLVAGFILLVLMIFTAMTWIATDVIAKQSTRDAKKISEVFAQQSALALLYRSQDNANQAVDMALSFPYVEQVAIYDVNYDLLYEKQQPDQENWQWQPGVKSDDNISQLEYSDHNFWQFIAPVFDGGSGEEETPFDVVTERNLIGYVRLLKSKEGQQSLISKVIAANTMVSVLIAILLLCALNWLTRRITAPLSVLVNTMSEAKEKQANLKVSLEGAKELQQIGSSFNEMMSILNEHQEQLKEYARLKEEFTANVSHEVRTPLTGIVGVMELLQDDELSREDQKQLLRIAINSSNTLSKIINDILDFSKISAGKFEIEHISLDLKKLFEDLVTFHSTAAKAKQIQISCIYESDVPNYVLGDSVRIQQILNNLISNSIKFTEKGEIKIRVSLLRKDQNYDWLKIEVSDTGIGITKSKLKQIFESYSQGEKSVARKYGGTGLGLAICKQLVELMDGKISVTSEVNQGTCFSIELPFKESYSDSDLEEELSLQKVNENFSDINAKILLVEDNIVNQQVIEAMLEKIGFTVDTVDDGHKAVEALKEKTYTLIFMDCQLPEMDGLEATRRIRKLNNGQIPIIALTANASPEDIERYKEVGMDDILAKPFDLRKLVDILVKWLRS